MEGQQTRPPRLIAIFGSGETSPTLTSVHKQPTTRVGSPELNAIFLRHLVVRLGDLARNGGREEVRKYVAPPVDVLVSMRRAILSDCGVEVQDTPAGTEWSLVNA